MTRVRSTEPAAELLPVRLLGPHREPEQQDRVAEHRHDLADEQDAEVAVPQEITHGAPGSRRRARWRAGTIGPLTVEGALLEGCKEREDLLAEPLGLLRRRPEREVVRAHRLLPLLGQLVVGGPLLANLVEPALVDDVGQQLGRRLLSCPLGPSPAVALGDVAPGPFPAVALARLLDEAPPGELAKVVGAAGRAVVEAFGALGRREGTLGEQHLEQVQAAGVRQGPHRPRVGEVAVRQGVGRGWPVGRALMKYSFE